MERQGFSPDQYRDFHPGGSLGRALIRVRDLMHSGDAMPLARDTAGMREVLLTMVSGRQGCAGIVDDARRADRHRHRRRHPPSCADRIPATGGIETRKAAVVMTPGPKIARPDQLAAEALALMTEKKITQLFVLAEGSSVPLGVLHIHDCLQARPA